MKTQSILLPWISFLSTLTTIQCKPKNIQDPEKPNLLVVMTDEHNKHTLSCYRELMNSAIWGEGVAVDTPNIDALAKEGVIFQNYYSNSPVCTPSRASFVSGLYPNATGAWANHQPMYDDTMTFARLLKLRRNYKTGYVGKWHLDGEEKPGFNAENDFGWTSDEYKFNRGHWKFLDKEAGSMHVYEWKDRDRFDKRLNKHFTTDYLFDRGIEFINESVEKDKSFALMISIPDPHGPNNVRPPYDTMFDHLTFEVPKTAIAAMEKNPARPAWGDSSLDIGNVEDAVDDMVKDEDRQRKLRWYFGMVKCIDDNLGKLMKVLRINGLKDNTIVVFTSDHGDLLEEHMRYNKGNPYQSSASAPLIIRHPGHIKPGKVIKSPFTTIDFFPTIMRLLNADNDKTEEPLSALHGIDLSEEILNDAAVTNNNGIRFMTDSGKKSWAAAYTSKYLLVLQTKGEPTLFDWERDPDEMYNFFDDPDYSDIAKELTDSLVDEMFKFNFTILMSSDDPIYLDTPSCWDSRDRVVDTKTCSEIDYSSCGNSKVREACPVTCQDCCSDSKGKFIFDRDILSCEDIKGKDEEYCTNMLIRKFCPVTCNRCTPLTDYPSISPSEAPSDAASLTPTMEPSAIPSSAPTSEPSLVPTDSPSDVPSFGPTFVPSDKPSESPSFPPSGSPSDSPSFVPTKNPTDVPSDGPSSSPSDLPSKLPTDQPSDQPSDLPSEYPSVTPSDMPSILPSDSPSSSPTLIPSDDPSLNPSQVPSQSPSDIPSYQPSEAPSYVPSDSPSMLPSSTPSDVPSMLPSDQPSAGPSVFPSLSQEPSFSILPTQQESSNPSLHPSFSALPSSLPTTSPSKLPSPLPSIEPSTSPPSLEPTQIPTALPTSKPSEDPTTSPSKLPSPLPSIEPSTSPPSLEPTQIPTALPTSKPSEDPTKGPSGTPSNSPTVTDAASDVPSSSPTALCEDSGETFGGKLDCKELAATKPWLCRTTAAYTHCRKSCDLCSASIDESKSFESFELSEGDGDNL